MNQEKGKINTPRGRERPILKKNPSINPIQGEGSNPSKYFSAILNDPKITSYKAALELKNCFATEIA